jgi:hypothetical protein
MLPKLKAISFKDFVEYGKANAAHSVGGVPWSFTYEGHPVTHETDECYLIGCKGERFTPRAFLVTSSNGGFAFFLN